MGTPFFYPAPIVALEDLHQHHWNTEAQIILESAPAKAILELVLLICGVVLKRRALWPQTHLHSQLKDFFWGSRKP